MRADLPDRRSSLAIPHAAGHEAAAIHFHESSGRAMIVTMLRTVTACGGCGEGTLTLSGSGIRSHFCDEKSTPSAPADSYFTGLRTTGPNIEQMLMLLE